MNRTEIEKIAEDALEQAERKHRLWRNNLRIEFAKALMTGLGYPPTEATVRRCFDAADFALAEVGRREVKE